MTEQQTFWAMPAPRSSPPRRKLEYMHLKFGASAQLEDVEPPRTCGGCRHLQTFEGNTKNYFKCVQYGVSKSEATDWRKKWIACGLYLP